MTLTRSPTKTTLNTAYTKSEQPARGQRRKRDEGGSPGAPNTPLLAPVNHPADPLSPLDLHPIFAEHTQEGVSNFTPIILKCVTGEPREEGEPVQQGPLLLMYLRYLSDEPSNKALKAAKTKDFQHSPGSPFRSLHAAPKTSKTILETLLELNRQHLAPIASASIESTDDDIGAMSSDEAIGDVICPSPTKKRKL